MEIPFIIQNEVKKISNNDIIRFQQQIQRVIHDKLIGFVKNPYNSRQNRAIRMFWGLPTNAIIHKKSTRKRTIRKKTSQNPRIQPIRPIRSNLPLSYPNISANRQRSNVMVVIGPPGTGKTTVIVGASLIAVMDPQWRSNDQRYHHYIYIATSNNSSAKRVLRSFHNFFLDNNISNGHFFVKRYLGNPQYNPTSSLDRELRPYAINSYSSPNDVAMGKIFIGTIWQLQSLSSNFNTYPFLLISDETSQFTPPMSFVPATHTSLGSSRLRGVCLIGDHLQLPPITTFTEMRINSLQFIMQHTNFSVQNIPQSRVIELNIQYRMHPAIRQVAEIFTMGRHLQDASNTIHLNHLLQKYTPDFSAIRISKKTQDFLTEIFDNQKTVVVLNTSTFDTLGSNRRQGSSRRNDNELTLVNSLVKTLKIAYPELDWNNPDTLKLISPYRVQAEEMHQNIHPFAGTADSFQGQESDIVIVSLVFNDTTSSSHLNDDQRLHVMMSRARSKLIIIGFKDNFTPNDHFYDVFNFQYNNTDPSLPYNPVIHKDITGSIFSDLSKI